MVLFDGIWKVTLLGMCDRAGAADPGRALVPVAGIVDVAIDPGRALVPVAGLVKGIITGCCGDGGGLLGCAIAGCEATVALVAGAGNGGMIHGNLALVHAGLSGFDVDDCALSSCWMNAGFSLSMAIFSSFPFRKTTKYLSSRLMTGKGPL